MPTHAVLIPGFWLGGWAWGDTEASLRAADVLTHSVTLPGLDATRRSGVTLEDQVDAVEDLADTLVGDVVLVGHSGGAAVAQGVIDRQPDRIRRVIYVDSAPLSNGVSLKPDADADIPLPSWEELAAQGSSTEGMDESSLDRFRQLAVDEPAGVASAQVTLANDRRHRVPVSVICTSVGSANLMQMIESGDIPSELASVHDVTLVDLPTGHWPMFSRPVELGAALMQEIRR